MGSVSSAATTQPTPWQPFKILFVRHGLSQNNVMKLISKTGYTWSGCRIVSLPHHCDAPLTLAGRHQATKIGELLSEYSSKLDLYDRQIFCSDMARAIGTAGYMTIGWRRGSTQSPRSVIPLPFFAEMSASGNCTNQCTEEHLRDAWHCNVDPASWDDDTWKRSHECAGDFKTSAEQWHADVIPWLHTRVHSHATGKVPVVVCHGRYIRQLLGMWSRLVNTQPVLATYDCTQRKFVDFEVLQPTRRQCVAKGSELLAKMDRKKLDPVVCDTLDALPAVHYHVYPPTVIKL